MNPKRRNPDRIALALIVTLAAAFSLAGCSFLKPTKTTARKFILTPLPAAADTAMPGSTFAGIGVGQVRIASYLANFSLAIRRGTNEIDYLPLTLWAERLDNGLQRVLASNLGVLLATDRVRLSAWRSQDVSAEIYLTVQQFDVDAKGRGMLVAFWRILSPGGDRILKAGETRLTRQGAAPDSDPSGTVATLSELAAEFSRQLAQAVKDSASSSSAAAQPKS